MLGPYGRVGGIHTIASPSTKVGNYMRLMVSNYPITDIISTDLENFFSGHSYRRHSLVDRERFARWEIDQVLGDHPEHNYEITGEIMRDESVSAQEDRPGALADLADVVRADAQHDVDAEVRLMK